MTVNRTLAIALGAAALLGVAAAQAQELHQAKVPFAFEVAGQKLEPGVYRATLDVLGSLTIENTTTHQSVHMMPLPQTPADNDKSSLTFRCHAGQCFLSKVQFGADQRIYGVFPSKHEKELAGNEKAETVLVAMR